MEPISILITKEKLNKAIEGNENYEKIYSISLELDRLILEYYMKRER